MKIILAVLFCFLTFSAVHADSVVLTSGSMTGETIGVDHPYTMDVDGAGFSLTASGEPMFGNANNATPAPGQAFLVTMHIGTGLTFRSELLYDGTAYNSVRLFGGLDFSPFLLTIPTDTSSTFVDNLPFTMSGNLQFRGVGNTTIADLGFTGQGFARVNLQYIANINRFLITSVTYSFQPAAVAPVPEPTTFLLFGTGLLGSIAAYRRRLR